MGARNASKPGTKLCPPLPAGYRVVQTGASCGAQPATWGPLHRRALGWAEPWGQCQPRADLGATLPTFGGHTGRSYSTALLYCDPRNVKPQNQEAQRWHVEYFEQYRASDSDVPSCFFLPNAGVRGPALPCCTTPRLHPRGAQDEGNGTPSRWAFSSVIERFWKVPHRLISESYNIR